MTESISPRSIKSPEIRYQPSMLSVPSAATTVPPELQVSGGAPQPPQRPWRKLWFFTAVSALIGVGAAGALRSPAHVTSRVHSGSPGFKKSSNGHDLLWQKKSVTVYLDGSLAKIGPTANDAVMQAFGEWVGGDTKLPALRFDSGGTSTTPKQDGKSTVSYAPITAPGHEHDVAITMTYSNDKTGEIIEADVVLNALYPMGVLTAKAKAATEAAGALTTTTTSGASTHEDEAMDCQNRYDAQNVVTHEAGHFFGLGEDMTERSATMFLSIDQCETHKRVLSTTDVGAVETLYQASQASDDSQGKAGCAFGGAPLGGSATLISGLILGLGVLRRRPRR